MRIQKSERGIFEPKLTEEHVLSQCRSVLEWNGFRVHRIVERIPWGRKTSTPGMPDLMFWARPGISLEYNPPLPPRLPCFGFIEVKKPGGKHRPAQEKWIADARADGIVAFFADSVESMAKGFAEYGIRIRGL